MKGSIESRILQAMRLKGITKTEMATRLGLTFVGISKMLAKENSLKFKYVLQMSNELGIPVEHLVSDKRLDDEPCSLCLEKDETIKNLLGYIEQLKGDSH